MPELQLRIQPVNAREHASKVAERIVPLVGVRLHLGRAATNELSFPEDSRLSRTHLVLERRGTIWTIRDLGSKNGTFVNDAHLTNEQPIKAGDVILAGELAIQVEASGNTAKGHSVVFIGDEPTSDAEDENDRTVITDLNQFLRRNAAQLETPGVVQRHMEALVRAGRELAGHRPLDELFSLILDLSLSAVSARRGVLMLMEGDELVPKAAKGDNFRISRAVCDQVIRQRQSLLVKDTQFEKALLASHSIAAESVKEPCGGTAADQQRSAWFDLSGHSARYRPLHGRRPGATNRDGECRGDSPGTSPTDIGGTGRALNAAGPRPGRGNPTGPFACDHAGRSRTGNRRLSTRLAAPWAGTITTFSHTPDGQLAAVLGDVAGKGMAAALMMSGLHARTHLLLDEGLRPGEYLTRLNRATVGNCPQNRFVTIACALVNPVTGTVHYASAGHNPAIIVRASGEIEMVKETGLVLGILKMATYQDSVLQLNEGDLLVLYSDGITEATRADSDEEFGEHRLCRVLAANAHLPAGELIDFVLRAQAYFTGNAPAFDDATLVVIRRGMASGSKPTWTTLTDEAPVARAE
jgi:phosphoserine phosphatase RsbU/P